VTGYYIFPDGKVICGVETGKLLLWEGNLIKAILSISEDENCHTNCMIDVVKLFEGQIVTAGRDGWVKFWDVDIIDNIEADDFYNAYIKPVNEFQIFSNDDEPGIKEEDKVPACILDIQFGDGFWLIHDANGKIFRYEPATAEKSIVLKTNSGKLVDMAICKYNDAACTIGQDGCVRLWDYINKQEYYSRQYRGEGTCLDWLNISSNSKDRIIAVGFKSGIVRLILFDQDGQKLLKAMKVHNTPISLIKFSPSGDYLVVISEIGEIFFFKCDHTNTLVLKPLCIFP